jgi:hypothetical protein
VSAFNCMKCFLARPSDRSDLPAFVAELAVEALGDAVLPGHAGFDQRRADDDPGQQSFGDELRTVITAQERRRAARAHEPRQHLDESRGERMRPSTSIARPSLVNSSVTVRHLSCWPLAPKRLRQV